MKGIITVEAAVVVSIYIIILSSLMLYSYNEHRDIVDTASLQLKKPLYTVYQILSLKHIGGELYENFRNRDNQET